MLMVSHANTNPGLTKTWDAGEPDKYFPTGKRNYARVVTTDDYQGPAAAQFAAKDLKVKKCFVLNDNETYGQGVAEGVRRRGGQAGHHHRRCSTSWDAKADANYTALFKSGQGPEPTASTSAASTTTTVASWSRTRSPCSATTPAGQADRVRTASPATRTC